MKIVVIIQARLGSTRLPRKLFLRLQGKTVLEHVIARVTACQLNNELIVATTDQSQDNDIEQLCATLEVKVFRGSETDVLDRFYQAAKSIKADHVVRITADCPVIDPQIIDQVIALHLKEQSDYTANTIQERYPDGEDVEVFTFKALEQAWQAAKLVSEREQVTPYLRNHSEVFKQASLVASEDWSNQRWTLDNQEDFEFLINLYNNLYASNPLFGLTEVLSFLKTKPELIKINQHIGRNEGYAKSLTKDKVI